jgi:hypothetical protein
MAMAFENTITEADMDANSQQFVQGLRGDLGDMEPDLSVDGLSESILSRIMGLFGGGKS